ncbi:MAG: nuclear transport factor 2 family protein [Nocardioides sp.]
MDLQQLSDRLEIEEVLVRYTRAIDTGDWDALDTVFTPDAHIDYRQSGGIEDAYAVVKPWLAENLPIFPKRMHTLGQVEIRYAGADAAAVAAYFHNPMMLPTGDGSEVLVEFGGIYHHRMVRTADGWRSEDLVEDLVWKRGL